MAWACYSCLNCDKNGEPMPEVCPDCGHPVDEWEGTCSSCPHYGDCIEYRLERWW